MKLVFYIATVCLVQGTLGAVVSSDSIARKAVQTILNFFAKELPLINGAAQNIDQYYFADPELTKNNTVKLYVKIGTAAFDEVADLIDEAAAKLNVSSGGAELISCIQAQKSDARNNVEHNVENWGECVTKQVPNLSVGFKDQLAALNLLTHTIVDARDGLQSCKSADVLCFAQLASSLTSGVKNVTTILEKGTDEVVAAYKIMFGTDVPSCTRDVKKIFLNDISNLLNNLLQCVKL